jgi:hypothetical protein
MLQLVENECMIRKRRVWIAGDASPQRPDRSQSDARKCGAVCKSIAELVSL